MAFSRLGLVIGRGKFNVFAVRAAELIENRPELIAAVRPLLEARKAIEQQVDDLDRKVHKLARHDVQVRRFLTVPGVGPITALCFKARLGRVLHTLQAADLHRGKEAGTKVGKGLGADPYRDRVDTCQFGADRRQIASARVKAVGFAAPLVATTGKTKPSFNRDLAEALVQIAREWVKLKPDELAELTRLTGKMPMPKPGLTPRTKLAFGSSMIPRSCSACTISRDASGRK